MQRAEKIEINVEDYYLRYGPMVLRQCRQLLGVVALNYPESEDEPTILEQNKKILLGSAYELDEALGLERFFFITSKSKIKEDELLRRDEALAKNPNRAKEGGLRLPETFSQSSIVLIKGVK